jgi:hypothetical protein
MVLIVGAVTLLDRGNNNIQTVKCETLDSEGLGAPAESSKIVL